MSRIWTPDRRLLAPNNGQWTNGGGALSTQAKSLAVGYQAGGQTLNPGADSLVISPGTPTVSTSAPWLQTDFAGFASLNAMMEAGGGPFYERDVLGDATWTLANTTDYLGNTKQCLRFDLYRNEDLALLGFVLPDTTYGTAGSGQDTIYYRFREKRSSNYRYLADKSSRVVSKYGGAGGSAYIDILTAFGGGGVSGNSSTVTQAFGQANVNDSNYIDTSYSWAVNTWILVEVEIVLGTVNGGDSRYRYWINGTLVGDATGFSILEGVVQGGTDFHRFQEFRLGGWESGGSSNNFLNGGVAESRWYDDLYIAALRPS